MKFRKNALWLLALLLVIAGWSFWWLQPERQLRRAQGRLFTAMEKRDFTAMASLLAEDYRDRWHHDKTIVIDQCREVFGQFVMLDIKREDRGLEIGAESSVLREKLTVSGIGGPLAMVAKDEVNLLREPFSMTWHRRSWKPWDWELISVDHPELRLPE